MVWLATPFLLKHVVDRNAEAGEYGVADATMIPSADATVLALMGIPYFGLLIHLAFRPYQSNDPLWWLYSMPKHFVSLLLILPGLFVLFIQVMYWWSWNHAPIVVGYSLSLLWLLWVRPMLDSDRVAQ